MPNKFDVSFENARLCDEVFELKQQLAEKDDQLMMCNRVAKGYSSYLKEGDTGWSYVIPTINYVIDRMVKAEEALQVLEETIESIDQPQ